MTFLGPQAVNGEIGTKHLAEIAVDTLVRFNNLRRVVTLGIKLVRELQDAFGAIFNAESAPLAAFLYNMKFPPRDFNSVDI
jgi:hypothetical protein